MEHRLLPQGFLSHNRRQKLSEEVRDVQETQMEITESRRAQGTGERAGEG